MGKVNMKRLRAELKAAALLLPPMIRIVKRGVKGQYLLDKNPNAKDADGKAILPDGNYTVDFQEPVNHYKVMKGIFKTGGAAAVDKYVFDNAQAANNAVA